MRFLRWTVRTLGKLVTGIVCIAVTLALCWLPRVLRGVERNQPLCHGIIEDDPQSEPDPAK
jgi:hypothetical protein